MTRKSIYDSIYINHKSSCHKISTMRGKSPKPIRIHHPEYCNWSSEAKSFLLPLSKQEAIYIYSSNLLRTTCLKEWRQHADRSRDETNYKIKSSCGKHNLEDAGLGRSSGEGNGNLLQYSCLGNPMDRETWRAIVYRVSRVGHDLVTKPLPPG